MSDEKLTKMITDKMLEDSMWHGEVLKPPVHGAKLTLNNWPDYTFMWTHKPPNRWWRMWQWLFFGFKWEKL